MTIKYKFNKSSEARDCVVESVELKSETFVYVEKSLLFEDHRDMSFYIKTGTVCESNTETKTFTSPQQLKDYINTIQEPIEFIAELSIDDVLMKEWIGEWNIVFSPLTNDFYRKTPKLNSNWTFKIQ